MEEDKNREQDVLAAAFREKLANHSLPVDPAVWEGIQAKVAAASGPKAAMSGSAAVSGTTGSRKVWWISLSAAASLALLISLGWYLFSDVQAPIEQLASTDIVASEVPATKPEDRLAIQPANRQPAQSSVNSLSNARSATMSAPGQQPSAIQISEGVQQPGSKQQPLATQISEGVQQAGSKQQPSGNKQSEPQLSKKLQVVETPRGDWTELLPERKRRKPLLAAGISSGMTGSDPGLSGLKPDAMYESFIDYSDRPMRAPAALAPADFKTRDYSPSLSAGVKVRLPFSDSWSVETGLQYSYLHTKLSDASWSGYWAEQQLHYLGLPVGVAATISRSSNWEFYWSGGIMVEKGLHSLYREYRDWGSAVFTTTASSKIDGWQWSAYTSFGVGYQLDKHLMIYFDPQIAYFFDNEQPLSIRTEMPLVVGLSAGMRFTF